MYNQADSSYMLQPKYLSNETIEVLIDSIHAYCLLKNPHAFQLIFHGGEPLLIPKQILENFILSLTAKIPPTTQLQFFVQTNGVLLTDSWLEFLRKHQISIGISLDGSRQVNDQHRLTHKGDSSFDAVMKGIENCHRHHQYFGVLGVVNANTDPIEQYHFFKSLHTKQVDFLLPHHHHDNPPATSYAQWWISLFDEWFYDSDDTKPNIRFLTQIILNCIGAGEGFDMCGQETNDYLVIETDGSIETVDAMKICGEAFTKENYHISTHTFEEALQSPLMNLYHQSHQKLANKCQKCPIVEVCGGGFLPHRFSKVNGFDNPSVYCHDLQKIIIHIQHAVIDSLSEETVSEAGLAKFDEEFIEKFVEEKH